MKAFFVRMSGTILKSPSFPLAEQHNHNKINGINWLQKAVEKKIYSGWSFSQPNRKHVSLE